LVSLNWPERYNIVVKNRVGLDVPPQGIDVVGKGAQVRLSLRSMREKFA
jgi:hypothetical protein